MLFLPAFTKHLHRVSSQLSTNRCSKTGMMTTTLLRTISSPCCKQNLLTSYTCLRFISGAINCQHRSQIYAGQKTARCLQTDSIRNKKSEEELNAPKWSVIAYNLSERLQIEKAKKLLDKFSEYQIAEIPIDLQKEAIVLSSKPGSSPKSGVESGLTTCHDIFLFHEGSIVFWGVPYDQQKRILYSLSPLKIEPYSNDLIQDEREHMQFVLDQTCEKSRLTRDLIQLASRQDPISLRLDQFTVSHAIALSVKLGIWESKLDQYIDSVGWVTSRMQDGKSVDLTRDQVFRKTGEIYHLKHRINLSSELLDLPDVYWDRHDQEILFLSLTSFLNIKKRTAVINEKLNNCCELMNLLAGHMNDKHHVRLEWMIIALIMVEVGFEFVSFFR